VSLSRGFSFPAQNVTSANTSLVTTLVQENSHQRWYSFWGLGQLDYVSRECDRKRGMRYDETMKSKLDRSTTPEQKMQRFQSALGRVLQVSHDEMKQALAEDEKIRRLRKGKPGPKPSSASGRASDSET
jgi:hypothetical protein